jgi:hypothetical protein
MKLLVRSLALLLMAASAAIAQSTYSMDLVDNRGVDGTITLTCKDQNSVAIWTNTYPYPVSLTDAEINDIVKTKMEVCLKLNAAKITRMTAAPAGVDVPALQSSIAANNVVVGPGISVQTQSASVAATAIATAVPAGLYLVCWSSQITRAATTSSSLTITLGWNNGSAQTKANAALATNTLNAQDQACVAINAAASSNITLAATYASTGGTSMQFGVRARVLKLL